MEGLSFGAMTADRAFDAGWLLKELEERGAQAVIPPRKNRRQIRAAPFARDSGAKKGVRRVQGGRFRPRRALCMAAVAAVRFNKDMSEFYEAHRAGEMS